MHIIVVFIFFNILNIGFARTIGVFFVFLKTRKTKNPNPQLVLKYYFSFKLGKLGILLIFERKISKGYGFLRQQAKMAYF